MDKRVYVWEFPVRLTHWLNVLSITALFVTGIYVGAPYFHAVSEDQLIMAQMRYIHFIAGYVFTVSVLIRIYWWFVGNKYARLNQFIFANRERWKDTTDTVLFYLFLKKDIPHDPGHTGIAGLTYFCMFMLFLLQILTGFALYSQTHVGAFWTLMGGWLFTIIGQGPVRLIHHLITWAIGVFLVLHIYISFHNDIVEGNGLVSSIFSGYKTLEK